MEDIFKKIKSVETSSIESQEDKETKKPHSNRVNLAEMKFGELNNNKEEDRESRETFTISTKKELIDALTEACLLKTRSGLVQDLMKEFLVHQDIERLNTKGYIQSKYNKGKTSIFTVSVKSALISEMDNFCLTHSYNRSKILSLIIYDYIVSIHSQ